MPSPPLASRSLTDQASWAQVIRRPGVLAVRSFHFVVRGSQGFHISRRFAHSAEQ